MPAMDPLIAATITTGIALLFATAAVHKMRDWPRFRETVANYGLLPRALVPWAAMLIVAIEAAIVVGCIVPSSRAPAMVVGGVSLLAYAAAMATNLARGRALADCGCGGFRERQPIAWWMVRRNLLLAVFSLAAAWPVAPRPLATPELLMIILATASVAGLYLAHATLAGNRRYFSR